MSKTNQYLINILLLCLAKSLTSFDFNWDNDIIVKYSKLKILSTCLGDSFIQSWKQSVKSSTEKCFEENSLGELPLVPSILEDILRTKNFSPPRQNIPSSFQNPQTLYNYYKQPPSHPLHYFQNNNPYPPPPFSHPTYVYMFANTPQQPLLGQSLQGQPLQVPQRQNNRIWKRSPVDKRKIGDKAQDRLSKKLRLLPEWRSSPDDGSAVSETLQLLTTIPKVNKMRKQLGDRISNITCVLKSMELLDDKGMPNYEYNSELIRRLRISEDLRTSLLESQNFCREFSMCVPVQRISNLLVREIGYSLVFMKCMKKKILQACMEQDMKQVPDFVNSIIDSGRASYASRSLDSMFDESPEGVANDIENYFSSDDEVAFGF